MAAVILWRRLDTPGHDSAILAMSDHGWTLCGAAAFRHDREHCGLGYSIVCDERWQTRSVAVFGHIGSRQCDFRIENSANTWTLNGIAQLQTGECVDIDLGFDL